MKQLKIQKLKVEYLIINCLVFPDTACTEPMIVCPRGNIDPTHESIVEPVTQMVSQEPFKVNPKRKLKKLETSSSSSKSNHDYSSGSDFVNDVHAPKSRIVVSGNEGNDIAPAAEILIEKYIQKPETSASMNVLEIGNSALPTVASKIVQNDRLFEPAKMDSQDLRISAKGFGEKEQHLKKRKYVKKAADEVVSSESEAQVAIQINRKKPRINPTKVKAAPSQFKVTKGKPFLELVAKQARKSTRADEKSPEEHIKSASKNVIHPWDTKSIAKKKQDLNRNKPNSKVSVMLSNGTAKVNDDKFASDLSEPTKSQLKVDVVLSEPEFAVESSLSSYLTESGPAPTRQLRKTSHLITDIFVAQESAHTHKIVVLDSRDEDLQNVINSTEQENRPVVSGVNSDQPLVEALTIPTSEVVGMELSRTENNWDNLNSEKFVLHKANKPYKRQEKVVPANANHIEKSLIDRNLTIKSSNLEGCFNRDALMSSKSGASALGPLRATPDDVMDEASDSPTFHIEWKTMTDDHISSLIGYLNTVSLS